VLRVDLCVCLLQLLVRAAYEGGLAHPLIPDPDSMQHITPQTLATFVAQNYTGKHPQDVRACHLVAVCCGGKTTRFPVLRTRVCVLCGCAMLH
jgi:hypothetical protein